MSFTLNTNITALESLYYLEQTDSALQQSIQRLSTGLQINSPADNPAGYVTANSLQTQIDGLDQAITNTQSDTNEVKTATGALSQISTLVQNIRSAALDASSNPSNAVADQQTIQSAIQSINEIAATTSYGSTNLLDGSAGTSAAVTNSTLLGGATMGGEFGTGVTQAGNVTITVLNAATEASVTGNSTYASVNSTIAMVNGGSSGTGGTVVINGQSIVVSGSETVQTLLNQINNLAGTTGVSANFSAANGSGVIVLTQEYYGANFRVSESESANLITNGAGADVAGLNATVSVSAQTQVAGVTATQTVVFSGGRNATDSGLLVSDANGNSILLTQAGNATSTVNQAVASVTSNPVQFQIGPDAGQTVHLSFNNASASSLGATAIAGQSLATIDVTTPAGAANAITIADAANTQLSTYQAQLGSFQTNVLQTMQSFMNTSVTNLQASYSDIMDVNVAQETVNLTNLQLLQQSGTQALYAAENLSAAYLKLLPG